MFRVRQLDVVATIFLALAVGVLDAFDVVGPTVTGGATLTTLGLLAISSLHGRTALAKLDRSVAEMRRDADGRASVDLLLTPSTSGADLDLRGADDIRIVGVTLGRTLRNNHAILRERLDAGATVRIALIAPQATTVEEAARRSTVPGSPEIFTHRLRPTLDLLEALAEHAAVSPGHLQVRLLDFVPAFGLIAVNPEAVHGSVHVEIYSHRNGAPEPTLPLYAGRDLRWFRHFVAEFERVWTVGHPHAFIRTGG